MKIYKLLIIAATCVLTSCVDSLFDESSPFGNDPNAVGFSLHVQEQPDMQISIGSSTRSGSSGQSLSAEEVPAPSNVRVMDGDNPYALKMQYMTLPYVGIHNSSVRTPEAEAQTADQATRASWEDRVISGSNSDEHFHDSLTVWGYTRDAATTIFDKTLVQRSSHWRTSGHWPFGETGPMRFYAVAPSLENINMSVADADFSTPPVLTYTLPEKAQDMCDLLYGESAEIDIPSFGTKEDNIGNDNKMVNLQFQHILTAIRFAQGNIPSDVTVKKISIKNVNTKATFIPSATDNMTDSKGTWSDFSTSESYTMCANFTGSGVGTTPNTYINDSVFYMLPQTVQSGVEMEVVIESAPKYSYSSSGTTEYDGSEKNEHTLKCSLSGDVWKKGYTVTYLLTIGEVADGYYFVAAAPAEQEHSDVTSTHNFTLHSFRMYVNKETDPTQDIMTHGVNWKVAGYYSDADCTEAYDGSDAQNAPSWLTDGIFGISSGVTGEYVGGNNGTASYRLSAQTPTKSGNHADNLFSNSNASQASSLDLSNYDPNGNSKSEETANCYIVNRRGSYTFPLVYGNKSENGNEADYFVDHTGTRISYSKIEDQIKAKNPGAEVYEDIDDTHKKRTEYTWSVTTGDNAPPISLRAVIVWQDYDGLISEANIPAGADKLYFYVNKSYPGNAVIALQARKVTIYKKNTGTSGSPVWVTDTDAGTSGYDLGDWETLWTWHIWMTDEVYPNYTSTTDGATNKQYLNNDETVGSGTNYAGSHLVQLQDWGTDGTNGTEKKTILPVNLGWVPKEMDFKYYSKRDVYVKLQQVEPATGAATTVVHIVQHAKQPNVRGQGTFYQWGRPTALPGYNFTDDSKTKRTIYFPNSEEFKESDFIVENITNPWQAISQPTKLFRVEEKMKTWSSAGAMAYWGDTKTVYDPCPPGFKVPSYTIFTGLSLTGQTATNGSNLNMWEDAGANFYGGYMYVDSHKSRSDLVRYAQTVYFPATGQYQATKSVGYSLWLSTAPTNNYIESMPCTVWCNAMDGTESGQALNLYPDYTRENTSKPPVELPRTMNLSTACAIRPVAK